MHPRMKSHVIKTFLMKNLKVKIASQQRTYIVNTDVGKIQLNNRPRVLTITKKSSGCWGGEFTVES